MPVFRENDGEFVSYSFHEYMWDKYSNKDAYVVFGCIRYLAKWQPEVGKHKLRLAEDTLNNTLPEIKLKFGESRLLLAQG